MLTAILRPDIHAQYQDKGNKEALPCCFYIQVSARKVPGCCLEIRVFDPYCDDNISVFYFEKYDYSTGNWVVVAQQNADTMLQTICGNQADNPLRWRVRIINPNTGQPPYCSAGQTSWNGEVDISGCCPCPPNNVGWFTTYTMKDDSCPDDGCKIYYYIDTNKISLDSLSCFSHYRIDNKELQQLTNDILEKRSTDCVLAPGESRNFTITLYSIDGDSCTIQNWVSCPPNTDTTFLPCIPDCPEDRFVESNTDTITIPSCPGCTVIVNYTWRIACELYQDLQLTGITLHPVCQQECTDNQLYKLIVANIIRRNPMQFRPIGPGPDSCYPWWRIAHAYCWAKVWHPFGFPIFDGPAWIYAICRQSGGCCVQQFRVCYTNQDGERYSISIDTTFTPNNLSCDSSYYYDLFNNVVYLCEPGCDWLTQLSGMIHTGDKINNRISPMSAVDQNDNGIFPIFTIEDNKLNLRIKSNLLHAQNLHFVLSNTLGQIIIKQRISCPESECFQSIDIQDWPSGVYFYTIVQDTHHKVNGILFFIR